MNEFTTFTKKHYAIIIVVALLVGALSGAVAGPLSQQFLLNTKTFWQEFGADGVNQAFTTSTITISEEESATIDVVAKVNPAVVSIAISKDIPQLSENLFRVGGGSGFIIDDNGLIVTNKHVVSDDSAVYTVILANGKEYDGQVVARDPALDVALLKIDARNLPTVQLGDSDHLRIGQTVIAIGYALAEFGNTVTKGVVSGIGRHVVAGNPFGSSEILEEAIQTDAAINPGNSGGPLLNIQGQVIGINTAVSSEGQLLSFAIPVNSVKKTIMSVQKTGRIIRPWLGVRYIPVTPRLAELEKLPVNYGAMVGRSEIQGQVGVIPGSPAHKAGIMENDIILEINGKKLEDKNSLGKEIIKYDVGHTIMLRVLRKGQEKDVPVVLKEYPEGVN